MRLPACVLLGWLGGCVAEAEAEAGPGGLGGTSVGDGVAAARDGERDGGWLCDGTVVGGCDGPFTGVGCDLPCVGDGGAAGECVVARYCHSDGSTYGLATRNAVLFEGEPGDDEQEVAAELVEWIVEHPAELGLAEGLSAEDVELHPLPGARSSMGPLTIHRFAQTYHGVPVLAPDGVVTLVHGPQGAIAITGAILDGRTPYDHQPMQATAEQAVRSMLRHASARAHVPAGALEVVHATPVAVPMRQAIGWAGFVRPRGGGPRARVIVDADPAFDGRVLPLWSYRELGAAGLGDTEALEARALDSAAGPVPPAFVARSSLTTGAPLLGSVDDDSLEVQLATERVVVLDLHGERVKEAAGSATRVLDPTGEFLADTGAELTAQAAYHLFQSAYDFIDGRLTDPVTGAKRWDSANMHYTNGMLPGDAPPGTFSPRALVFVNGNSADCDPQATACMWASGYGPDHQAVMSLPELSHTPSGASVGETTGTVVIPGTGVEPVTLAHEFAHVVDLFTGGGITADIAPDCAGACSAGCVEDTTDEAPPLTESIAQLLTFVFLRQGFDPIDWEHCTIVDLVSRNGSNPWTPGACIPPGQDISLFQRPGACAKTDPYCDKPAEPGFKHDCCFDDEDLSECTLLLPAECPVGETGPSGGMGTGTGRLIPTGSCLEGPGYRTNSLYQAFWQMLNGQRCDPTPPFACVSATWGPGVDPMAATTDALLYALRTTSLTYEQLVDAMATYVSCTYGPAAYDEFNAVACNHGIRECDEPAPMICETCGNGVREGSETCDGSDWLVTACDELPEYPGGTLSCDQATCALDYAQCTMPGLDTTAGSSAVGDSSTSSTGEIDTEPGAVGTGSDGCGCRSLGSDAGTGWVLSLMTLLALGRRRRFA